MNIAIMTRTDCLDGKNRVFVNETYMQKIIAFSHTPIPVYGNSGNDEIAQFCDALILPGGYDIAPFYFRSHYDPHSQMYEDPTMDVRDFAVLHAFIRKKKPILGICRGIQLINVYFQGTLHQHIDTQRHESGPHMHKLHIVPDSALSMCMNDGLINSYHHQTIDELGKHLSVCAYAEDGSIEAIAHDTLPILAVQWHPEIMENDAVFPFFFHFFMNTPL